MAGGSALNQDGLRNHNLSVVLSTLLSSGRHMSRADIAKATGMTKASISLLTAVLVDKKVLQEGVPELMATTGRPSSPLEFVPHKWLGLGVQINTDGFGYVIQDFNGEVMSSQWIDDVTMLSEPRSVFDYLYTLVKPAVEKLRKARCRIIGGGLALPGIVTSDGTLVLAPNLGWRNLDLTSFELVKKYGLTPLNEANLAATAQIPGYAVMNYDRGEAEEADDNDGSFIYISTDVGIGGAYVSHGSVVMGSHGIAGEIGHLSVSLDGPVCRCGRQGCLESYAGRRAVLQAAGIDMSPTLDAATSYELLRKACDEGDKKALAAVDSARRALISVIVSAINLLDVSRVVLGGFWSRFGEDFAQAMSREVGAMVLDDLRDDVCVSLPTIREHAAVHGAAYFGLRRLVNDPSQYFED